MDRNPVLKNAQFLQEHFTFNELPVWYRDNRLGSPILHVSKWVSLFESGRPFFPTDGLGPNISS